MIISSDDLQSPLPSLIGLIPARSGSKRISDKNIRVLAGYPLLAYTIAAARQSGVFSSIIVSTDSELYAEIARYYGAETPYLRPAELADELSPDIEWIEYTLTQLKNTGLIYDCFSILRPTSPFRKAETIRRAWQEFLSADGIDSLRAVEKCSQHPGKMWIISGERMVPLLPFSQSGQPWHSCQYQALPEIYIQNASLEIAWSRVVFEGRTIAGQTVMPFLTQGYEGFDINRLYDWKLAEELISCHQASLPTISQLPFKQ